MAGPYKHLPPLPPLDQRLRGLGLKVDLTPPKKPTPKKKKKPGAGAPRKFKSVQQAWLQVRYRLDLNADSLLAKHDAAVPHVQKLAKDEFGIKAGIKTVLKYVVRPVLRAS
jgi:hypothetical protein